MKNRQARDGWSCSPLLLHALSTGRGLLQSFGNEVLFPYHGLKKHGLGSLLFLVQSGGISHRRFILALLSAKWKDGGGSLLRAAGAPQRSPSRSLSGEGVGGATAWPGRPTSLPASRPWATEKRSQRWAVDPERERPLSRLGRWGVLHLLLNFAVFFQRWSVRIADE